MFLLVLAALIPLGCSDDDASSSHAEVQQTSTLQASARGSTRDVTVELHEGTNMAAAPSPDGSQVVFSAQGALWMVPVAGGDATRMTPWTIEPTAPVWAPDGSVIAFQNYTQQGNYHIWTIKPDGSELVELTSGPFDDREPAWTPDGSKLVFASDRSGDQQYKIWSYSMVGEELAQLSTGAGAESNPVVSPDSTQIAFVDSGSIYSIPLAGGERTFVTEGLIPGYTPDGMALLYQTPERALAIGESVVSDVDEDIFPFPVQWFADGRFLYTSDGKIRVRDGDGSHVKDIPFSAELLVRRPVITDAKDHGFDVQDAQAVLGISAPAISPDGQQVVFVALNDVWVMTIGEQPERLTEDKDRDNGPQWTADGSAVYFSSEKDNAGAFAIDRVELASGTRTRLGAIAGTSMVSPSMSPSGDRVAYLTGAGRLELLDVATSETEVIIDQVSRQVSRPQWTPDGSKIVLVDNEAINNRFREGYNKLRVIDLASKTGEFHAVADVPQQISDRDEGAAALSPDGSKVAFVMDSVMHVMSMNADGTPAGEPVAITSEVADLPSWAGDSLTLMYKSGPELKIIQADGSGEAVVDIDLAWQQAVGPATTIIRAGKLWAGVSDELLSDVDIVINANRIVDIRAHQETSESEADYYLDASELTVIPGLWDPHVHPLTLYQGAQFGQVSAAMLAYGITSVQSVAGPLHQSVELREALAAGNLVGPRLFVSPPLWEGNRQFYDFARTLRTPEVADLEIAKALALDTDYMKSYVRAPIPIMSKIAQAGLDHGIPTGTHMLSPGSAAGLGGTTHLSATQRMGYGWAKSVGGGIAYQDAYDLHAKSDFRVVDTLFSALSLIGQDETLDTDPRLALIPVNFMAGQIAVPPPTEDQLAIVLRDAEQSAKVAEAGGLIAIGTDTPLVAPGIALQVNLRGSAMAVGNVEALQNVTINAARMYYMDDDLGTVEVGKLADLAIVAGNPLEDITAAADVRYVVKNGVASSVEEILAPFITPAAKQRRVEAMVNHQTRCANGVASDAECLLEAHEH